MAIHLYFCVWSKNNSERVDVEELDGGHNTTTTRRGMIMTMMILQLRT